MEQVFYFLERWSWILLVLVGIGFLIINKIMYKKRINLAMNYKLLAIQVPRDISQDKTENTKKVVEMISSCDQMISNFNKFKYPIVFEVASPIGTKEIMFFVACHRKHIEMIQKLITAYFPFGEVSETNDYTVFGIKNYSGGAIGKLNTHFALPIKTYQNFENDPFSSILNAFSKIDDTEGMALQLILNSTSSEKKEIRKILDSFKRGEKEKDIFNRKLVDISVVKETLNPFQKSDKEKKESESKIVDETLVKSIESKLAQPLFNVNLRLMVSSPNKNRIDDLIQEIRNGFMQLSGPMFNLIEFKKQQGAKLKSLIFQYAYRLTDIKMSMVLNSSEINSFWHLPHTLIEVPNIKWLKFRSAQPPIDLPEDGIVIGKNIYRGEEKLIRQRVKDRRLHTYVIGQTGTGKTQFLKNMIIQDITDGKGVCFIDPHGDLADELLDFIPEERIKDVIYFNPSDPEYTLGFNILESSPEKQMNQTFIINEVLEIMDKLYDLKMSGGPIFEQYMRNTLSLLMSDPVEQFTLLEVPAVLINEKFRQKLLDRTTNFIVKDFWEKEAGKVEGDLELKNMAPYINSKLAPFLTNNLMRPIIGQTKSSLDFEEIVNSRKILIINLAKGLLGENDSFLIGMIMIGELTLAAFARAAIPENQREDFYLYIDEFQNITTRTIPQILSELRKYRLSLIIAHQFIAQVNDEIRDAIFGNVGTMVSFRVSNPDGEVLKKYFIPVFNEVDLVTMANYHAYVRLMNNGEPSRAFNIATILAKPPEISYRDEIVKYSNQTYAKLRAEVDQEIMERFRRNSQLGSDMSATNKTIGKQPETNQDDDDGLEEESEFDEKFLNEVLASIRNSELEKDKQNHNQ